MSNERQPQVLDLEKIVRTKAGKKSKYIPGFVIRWFERFVHLDFINKFLKEGCTAGRPVLQIAPPQKRKCTAVKNQIIRRR